MEIRYLRLIKVIVKEGSITRAIDKLHLSQSALSYQLKEAKVQLGTPIFYRHNKKLILTPIGKKLYKAANNVLKEIDSTEPEIKKLISGETGMIQISTECNTSYHWLPPVLNKFKNEFPNVGCKLYLRLLTAL
ncbi:DNA-binding transcriptional LysR family regulator [Catalinimonas alkaloidigena]|uniref:LysR family transcriptional regulator n=1 Tax=Catalinimonas alkaloidigena TaxID=1075417 RepID=UPI00240748BC|nr:LysR family transcriptional regulator [Catalinimonas alkaloidigena]MDF9801350.1 DNA-binding transcriptional LysR family regulator [Catalinimonas alkaloidigena]